jgi:hemerythrin superfamily protein
MVTVFDDSKRVALAVKLADMRELQNLLITFDQKLLPQFADQEIRNRFEDILRDDQKNIGVLDMVIVQYGIQAQPSETGKKMLDQAHHSLDSSQMNLFDKVSILELLKHQQVMSGLILHKAAQKVGADVIAAIGQINTINFENRAHQEQLKAILEVLGVLELTGEEADQGLWARVQDAVAAMTGVAGNVLNLQSQDIKVQDAISLDHRKVETLFKQIEASEDPARIREFFAQLCRDLSIHAEAEEETVYPAVRAYYAATQELYSEQAEAKLMLKKLQALNPSTDEFKAQIRLLKDAVQAHVQQEEMEMFSAIRDNIDEAEQKQLTVRFNAVKKRLQSEQMAHAN